MGGHGCRSREPTALHAQFGRASPLGLASASLLSACFAAVGAVQVNALQVGFKAVHCLSKPLASAERVLRAKRATLLIAAWRPGQRRAASCWLNETMAASTTMTWIVRMAAPGWNFNLIEPTTYSAKAHAGWLKISNRLHAAEKNF